MNMTYGDAVAENAKVIDYSFVNPILESGLISGIGLLILVV